MSFLSPLPGAGAGSSVLPSPGNLQSVLFASPAPEKGGREAQQAVREHRLSLERLEACLSQNQPELLADALAYGRLAKAPSAKQLEVFASLPTSQPRPQRPNEGDNQADAKQLEAAADSLAAKLQEQLMPWLKQQVQEALAGAKGGVDLQAELAGMNAKLQAALSQEEIMTRAASSIAEALPTVLAKQLRDSQEMSMEGSICAPKTQQHWAHPDPQAKKLVSTSANSGNSSRNGDDVEQQQATSAVKPSAHVARVDSAGEEVAMAETPTEEGQLEEDGEDDGGERPVKRMCYGADAPQLSAGAGASFELVASQAMVGSQTLQVAASQAMVVTPTPLQLSDLLAAAAPPATAGPALFGTATCAGTAGATARKGRRTNYVKMRELEASIQEARVVEQHLRAAVASAELQHASIMEENRQLWGAVAHINATLHAGHAAMLAEALEQQQQDPLSASQHVTALGQGPTPATMTTAGDISPDLEAVFASPDPMCLVEACGMLFSPAPATAKLLAGQQAAAGAAVAVPVNKPRKLFEDELVAAACCGAGMGIREPAGLPLLADLPKLYVVQ